MKLAEAMAVGRLPASQRKADSEAEEEQESQSRYPAVASGVARDQRHRGRDLGDRQEQSEWAGQQHRHAESGHRLAAALTIGQLGESGDQKNDRQRQAGEQECKGHSLSP